MNKEHKEIGEQHLERVERVIDHWQQWPFALGSRPVVERFLSAGSFEDKVPISQTVCLRSDDCKLALRFPVREPVSRHSLQLECTIQSLLAEQGIAPLAHLQEDCLISEWVEAEVIETIQGKQLDTLLRRVHKVHATDISNLNLPPYRYLEALKLYIAQAGEDLTTSNAQHALGRVAQFEKCFNDERCLTHNDLNTGNVLWQSSSRVQPRCWLIDWEFAGSGIASFDLAGIAVEFKIEQNQLHTAAIAAGLDVGKDELELAIDCYQLICHYYRQALSRTA